MREMRRERKRKGKRSHGGGEKVAWMVTSGEESERETKETRLRGREHNKEEERRKERKKKKP